MILLIYLNYFFYVFYGYKNMYRKQDSSTTVKEQIFQLRPVLIAIEFDKKYYPKTRDVKLWFQ